MLAQAVAFVDAGFLRRAIARALDIPIGQARVDTQQLVDWLRTRWWPAEGSPPSSIPSQLPLLRAYWYDGAVDPVDRRYANQRAYFDKIAETPGIQLRLGHMTARQEGWYQQVSKAIRSCGWDLDLFRQHLNLQPAYQQKGVDTLLVLDMVRLAQQNAYDVGLLITGDRDIAEAVRTAQDTGRRIILVRPGDKPTGVSRELRQFVDDVIPIPDTDLRNIARISPPPLRIPAVAPEKALSAAGAEDRGGT